jgi:imidazolonepropionase
MEQVFYNIGRLYGNWNTTDAIRGSAMKAIPFMENAWMQVLQGVIVSTGTGTPPEGNSVNMEGKWIIPAFVDSHCHLIFADWREREFQYKIEGRTYEEIAASGGGILNSARKLATFSEEQLFESAKTRLFQQVSSGIGAMEIKTGYGLLPEQELKMLRVAKALKQISPVPIKTTLLAAHALPTEFREKRDVFIQRICEELIPQAAEEKLADYVDVFCDKGFFTQSETETILKAAQQLGLRGKIHANELGNTGGIQAGVAYNARSVDHLEHTGPEEIEQLLNSDTIPTLLPGTAFFLRIPYPPARQLIDSGLPVALATDLNPGSCPSGCPWFLWSLACIQLRMQPEEALTAMTRNAAVALDLQMQVGALSAGNNASFIALPAQQPENGLAHFPYRFGSRPDFSLYLEGEEWKK